MTTKRALRRARVRYNRSRRAWNLDVRGNPAWYLPQFNVNDIDSYAHFRPRRYIRAAHESIGRTSVEQYFEEIIKSA